MCPHLSANYVLGCPSNMAQVSVWAGNLQVLAQLLDMLGKAGQERGRRAKVSLNWPQAVLRVRYVQEDILPAEVIMEEANEGEETAAGGGGQMGENGGVG